MTKIKIIIIISIPSLIIFYLLWHIFIFFPDDYDITREEALLESGIKSGNLVMDYSLIDNIDSAVLDGDIADEKIDKIVRKLKEEDYLIKTDSFINSKKERKIFRFGTGLPGIWVDERSSIMLPDNSSISFKIKIKEKCRLDFSSLSVFSGGKIVVDITGEKKSIKDREFQLVPYVKQYTEEDLKLKYCNIGYKYAKADPGWRDFSIDLSEFSGQNIEIRFSFDGDGISFISNPRIFRESDDRHYNVIYIVFDGVATRYFSFYNKDSNLTPYMRETAEKDFVVFDNMFTLGNKTRISTAGLFVSVLPFVTGHGINRNYIPEKEKEHFYSYVRNGELASLPDEFRKNGYVSEQFGNSGFTVHLISTGVDYGFDSSYEFSYNPYDSYGLSHRFFDFLRNNRNKAFFAYAHYNTPHKPFYAPLKYFIKGFINAPLEGIWRPQFLGCINYTDYVFRNVYLALKTNGLLENTIVVIATDHGAGYDYRNFDAGFQYNDYTRMSFMIYLPDDLMNKYHIQKKRVNTYLSSINTAPTLMELAGLKPPDAFKGKSFISVMNGDFKDGFFDRLIWCFGRKTLSVVRDDMYKYILTSQDAMRYVNREHIFFGDEREVPFEELFFLGNDPWERLNLGFDKQKIIKDFRKICLEQDIHHPEKTVLSFFPPEKSGEKKIEVEVTGNTGIRDYSLYTENLKELKRDLEYKESGNRRNITFKLYKEPLYLIFETEKDRVPLSIMLKEDGALISPDKIFSTYLNLNISSNPIELKDEKDFLIIKDVQLTLKGDSMLPAGDGLKVKLSRIDLHRWIDIGSLENKGLTAGMRETLKSWGYIQ